MDSKAEGGDQNRSESGTQSGKYKSALWLWINAFMGYNYRRTPSIWKAYNCIIIYKLVLQTDPNRITASLEYVVSNESNQRKHLMYPRITSFWVYFKDDWCTTWERYMRKGAPGIVRSYNCFICFRWYILSTSYKCGIFFEVIPTRVTS